MDVSFIIPARNERRTLTHTVASLRRTVTRHSFEIIVVDDDSDEALAEPAGSSAPVTYVRNATRLGVARSRNVGARMAGGDLLVFLDAHVCFEPGWLDALERHAELLSHGLIAPATFNLTDFGHFQALAARGRAPWPVRVMGLGIGFKRVYYGYRMTALPEPRVLANPTRKPAGAFTVPIAGGSALCVRRSFFFDLGQFEDEFDGFGSHEDAELCMRCWALGYWVAVIPTIRSYHYKARGSDPVDYRTRPFHSTYYERSATNALRMFYLHLSDDEFRDLLRAYAGHPGFVPDLDAVITGRLAARRALITERRIHDSRWVMRRMIRV